ncbi:hypothetical protein Tco_0088594 [Tanacetum coccineum]
MKSKGLIQLKRMHYVIASANKKIDLINLPCPPASKIIREILRRHPLCYALTASASVPLIYMQQMWITLKLADSKEVFRPKGRVGDSVVATQENHAAMAYKVSTEAYELNKNVKRVEEHLLDEDVTKLVEGKDSSADKFADEMMLSQEDPDTRIVMGEGMVMSSSSLDRSTKSCLGGIMVSLIFLKGLEEKACVDDLEVEEK